MHNLVYINTLRIGMLFIVTISTGIHENFVFFILFWVQHIVAVIKKIYTIFKTHNNFQVYLPFLTKSNTYKSWTLTMRIIPRHRILIFELVTLILCIHRISIINLVLIQQDINNTKLITKLSYMEVVYV